MSDNKFLNADELEALPTHSIISCTEEYGMHYVVIKHADKWAVSGMRERLSSYELVRLTEGKEIIELLKEGHEH